MKMHFRHKKSVMVIMAVTVAVFALTQCNGKGSENKEYAYGGKFENYAGPDKCASCHKEIYETHIKTAHYLTSQPAEERFIQGSFEEGKNIFHYSPDLFVRMEKKDSGFYQNIFFKGENKMSLRFDVVIGSGVMGQSYLDWMKGRLYQMPITFFREAGQWSTSPGFPLTKVTTDRPITARCLECHMSFAHGIGGTELEPNTFDPQKMIYGITCEKCHGPSARHVKFHEENPEEKKAKYVVNPGTLSRQLQLDLCALCHSGKWEKTKPSFTFTAGSSLTDYFVSKVFDDKTFSADDAEVHGNQYGLLKASKCFKNSTTMTCNTCHNTHINQRSDTAIFSAKCISCHNTSAADFQTPAHRKADALQSNCIDCHMPLRPSSVITVKLQDQEKNMASLIRSHFISVYPDSLIKYKHRNN